MEQSARTLLERVTNHIRMWTELSGAAEEIVAVLTRRAPLNTLYLVQQDMVA